MLRTLNREQRDLLWREAVYELDGDGIAFENGREEVLAAIGWAMDFARLYDDIGWEKDDPRESFTLTMPDDQLHRIVVRLEHTAKSLLRDDTTGLGSRERVESDLDLLSIALAIGREE